MLVSSKDPTTMQEYQEMKPKSNGDMIQEDINKIYKEYLEMFFTMIYGGDKDKIYRYLGQKFQNEIFKIRYMVCCENSFLRRSQTQQVLGEVDPTNE